MSGLGERLMYQQGFAMQRTCHRCVAVAASSPSATTAPISRWAVLLHSCTSRAACFASSDGDPQANPSLVTDLGVVNGWDGRGGDGRPLGCRSPLLYRCENRAVAQEVAKMVADTSRQHGVG